MRSAAVLLLAAVLLAASTAAPSSALRIRRAAQPVPPRAGTPSTANCTLLLFNQTSDHFRFLTAASKDVPLTFQQRVFYNTDYWKPGQPILFYAGNEADIELYVNHTGFMWENAQSLGAMLVWAEHRFYGQTQFTKGASEPNSAQFPFLTHEQAMADYATLLYAFKQMHNAENSPVIVLGGSYGGMLAAWLRLKYPDTFAGAIAASAPIRAFEGMDPAFDSNTYWQVVTRDASSAGGATDQCSTNIRNAWPLIFNLSSTSSGRGTLSSTFKLCSPLKTSEDGWSLAMYLLMAFDTMAMGNYPYPSNYLTGGGPMLPAYPIRAACQPLSVPNLQGEQLLAALRDGAAVYNNATLDLKCYTPPEDVEEDGIWDYQWCTEFLPQESYFTLDGVRDMFWSQPFNRTFIRAHCMEKFGVDPRDDWIRVSYGNMPVALNTASNIVFSNGLLDPWSSGGIMQNISDTVQAILIPNGAHHVDLFFSDPQDTPDITFARQFHLANIRKWLGLN